MKQHLFRRLSSLPLGILVLLLGAVMFALLFDHGRQTLEQDLRLNLATLRDSIDHYYADKAGYPHEFSELVREGYLRSIPYDPMTGRSDSWVLIYSCREGEPDPGGIFDVRSTSMFIGSDGKPYSEW